MKSKRRAPSRYHLCWRRHSGRWLEKLYARIPKHYRHWELPVRLEDLKEQQVFFTNFELREAAHFVNARWPKRESALRAIQRFYAPKPPKKPIDRKARWLAAEKRWLKKFRTAETKLRKIRANLRRLERRPRQ